MTDPELKNKYIKAYVNCPECGEVHEVQDLELDYPNLDDITIKFNTNNKPLISYYCPNSSNPIETVIVENVD